MLYVVPANYRRVMSAMNIELRQDDRVTWAGLDHRLV